MKFSIITINRNNAVGLEKTIQSVINQTLTDYEYIVIDGGSTDDSIDIIKRYNDKISYWVSEPDRGIYHAMNKGIEQAKGEYVELLNSGDWLCQPDTLQKLLTFNSTADIIYGNMLKVYPDGRLINDKGFHRSDLTLADMYFHTLNHSSSFVKRKLFDVYGLFNEDYKIVSDWVFFLKAIGLGKASVEYVDVNVNFFDMTGISNSQRKLRFEERELELNKSIPHKIRKDYEALGALQERILILDSIEKNRLSNAVLQAYKLSLKVAKKILK